MESISERLGLKRPRRHNCYDAGTVPGDEKVRADYLQKTRISAITGVSEASLMVTRTLEAFRSATIASAMPEKVVPVPSATSFHSSATSTSME